MYVYTVYNFELLCTKLKKFQREIMISKAVAMLIVEFYT